MDTMTFILIAVLYSKNTNVLRWRAYMILHQIPKDEWPSMHMKILAAEALKGRRRDWGVNRKWEGHYLTVVCINW